MFAPTPDHGGRSPAHSVRPPDLEPGSVTDPDGDVLAGWDPDADAAEVASWNHDRPPLPVDAIVLAAAGLAGLLAGLLLRGRRARGATLGALGGVVLAALVRRIWRLDL